MRFLIALLIFIIILGVVAAIDEPQENQVYFLLGIFLIWMVARLFFWREIKIPWLVLPFCILLLYQLGLFIRGPQSPLGFQWLIATLFFVLLLILIIYLLKNINQPVHWEDALILLDIAACLRAIMEIFFWYRSWW